MTDYIAVGKVIPERIAQDCLDGIPGGRQAVNLRTALVGGER
jgi:phosphoribosylaminoimidazole (AIR) synthetase